MAENEKEVIVTGDGGGSGGAIVAVVLILAVLIGLYLFFGTNLIRNGATDVNINVNTPSTK